MKKSLVLSMVVTMCIILTGCYSHNILDEDVLDIEMGFMGVIEGGRSSEVVKEVKGKVAENILTLTVNFDEKKLNNKYGEESTIDNLVYKYLYDFNLLNRYKVFGKEINAKHKIKMNDKLILSIGEVEMSLEPVKECDWCYMLDSKVRYCMSCIKKYDLPHPNAWIEQRGKKNTEVYDKLAEETETPFRIANAQLILENEFTIYEGQIFCKDLENGYRNIKATARFYDLNNNEIGTNAIELNRINPWSDREFLIKTKCEGIAQSVKVQFDYYEVMGESSIISDEEKGFAWAVAEREVKDRLKAPSKAKFPFSYGSDGVNISKSGDTYTVKAWVDAENSYGAKLRSNFTVQFTRSGKDMYTVKSVTID